MCSKYLRVFLLIVYLNTLNSIITVLPSCPSINVLGTGLFLPYSLGVLGYIKKNVPITKYKLTGISGGAWCSLLYLLEDDLSDHDKIWNYTMGGNNHDLKINLYSNLNMFHSNVEKNLKYRYKDISPDIIKNLPLTIGASKFDNYKLNIRQQKKSEFSNVNRLIDFCVCSSYIPYISGILMCNKYDDDYYMDGDFTRDKINMPIKSEPNILAVHRHMWGRKFKCNNYVYTDIETSRFLFEMGWNDTENNREKLLEYLFPTNTHIL
jgi:hypothetical protein